MTNQSIKDLKLSLKCRFRLKKGSKYKLDEVNKVVYKWPLEVKAHDLYKLSPLKLPTALVKFVRVLSIEYHASVYEEGKFHETPKKKIKKAQHHFYTTQYTSLRIQTLSKH
jgi:hypothetical protein